MSDTESVKRRNAARLKQDLRLLEQEGLIFDVTETICQEMENEKITRAKLATRLRKTDRYITNVLEGRNMTLREVADIFTALGVRVNLIARSIAGDEILKKRGDQGFVL